MEILAFDGFLPMFALIVSNLFKIVAKQWTLSGLTEFTSNRIPIMHASISAGIRTHVVLFSYIC